MCHLNEQLKSLTVEKLLLSLGLFILDSLPWVKSQKLIVTDIQLQELPVELRDGDML